MTAAKTGVLMNEEAALKTLGLTMVPSIKPGGKRQIITGISALDDDEELRVYYGVNRDPARSQTWGFSIDLYNDMICIRKESAEKIFGTTTDNFIFPLHDNRAFGGIYYYTVRSDIEASRASFRYVNRDLAGRCLSQFSIQPTTR
jgi:hypothetical protein